jgi:hypothetical protein
MVRVRVDAAGRFTARLRRELDQGTRFSVTAAREAWGDRADTTTPPLWATRGKCEDL